MKAIRAARRTIFFLATAVLLSGGAASAQDAPYVGAYEADNFFSTITTNEMNVLRTKKILFLSRSFGINMVEGLARLEAKNPVYDFNSSYVKYEVQTFGLGAVATNAFANYNFVHCMATYSPHTQRLIELSTLLRDPPYSFGTQVDVVMVEYHTATASLFDTYKSTMDSLQAEFPNVKFIYVTSGFSGPQYAIDNANSAAFGALVRTAYKGKVPLYDWGYILSNDGGCGDVSCPENITDPTGLHSDSPIGEERVGKAFLLMLRDLYFGSGCTSSVPPTVPAISGAALSDSSIRLTWDPSTHECGVARYELTRNGTMLTSLTKTNYTDTGLTENTAYRYALRAVSMAEVASAYSSTSTVSTLVDSTAPTVTLARAVSGTAISVTFSENLSSVSAQTATNYTLNYGVSVLSASLSGKTVTLFTSEMSNGTNYTLTINHVADASSATNSIAPGTQVSFTYLRVNYPEDPVAWWKFDGTLADASGNSLTGAWKNSTGTYTNALLGSGLALVAGSTGYVQVAHNSLLDGMTNGMTISIWAKKQDANLGGMLFIKSGAYRFGVFSNTFAYHFGTTQKTQFGAVSAISNINNTNWHHYCMSYNGINLTLSVDGTQRYSYSMTGDVLIVSGQSLYIGTDPYTPFKVVTNTVVTGTVVIVTNTVAAMSSFDGQLDEMKIFRRALSTNEIFGLYTNGLTGSADRQAVRNILDANGLTNRTVDSGSVYQKDRITKLYVQEAGISNLTADIESLSELTLLHCYGDRSLGFPMLTRVAPEIGSCSLLTELLLAQNSLTDLPSTITNLTKLTICSIGDNLLCGSYPWETWADTYDPDWRATQDCSSPLSPTAAFSANVSSGTVPLAVTFTDSSTGTITNRYWDFGDGATTNITSTSIAHTYASTGTYTVTLTVTGLAGTDTNTKTDLITVNPPAPPSAAFSASPLSGTTPLTVTFTDTSTGTITNRLWTFGDGATTNTAATSVAHTYASTGTYSVVLTVNGPYGTDTNTQSNLITVSAPVPPVAVFGASPTSGVSPLAVTFTDTSTGSITNHYWNFGDGVTTNTTATSLGHTYSSTGTYTVALTVSGPSGANTNTQISVISVSAAPTIGTANIISVDITDSAGNNTMSAGSLAGAPGVRTNNWNTIKAASGTNSFTSGMKYGDGTAVAAPFKITYAGYQNSQAATGLTDDKLMFAGYAQDRESAGYYPLHVTLTNIPFPKYDIYIYADTAYQNGGGRISMAGQQDYWVKTAGAMMISATGSTYIQITNTTQASASNQVITTTTGTGNYVKYSNLTGTVQDFTVDALSVYGLPTQRLNLAGFQIVQIAETAPVAGFSASPTSGVSPLAVTFTDTSTGSITNRFWDFGDGATTNTTATSLNHTYASTGTYSVSLIVSGTGGASTSTQSNLITASAPVVVPPPAPTVALGSSGSFGRGQDVLSWTTVQGSGYVYGVWYSTNLLNGFLPLQTNLADTVKSLTNIINAPSVFYKIEVQ